MKRTSRVAPRDRCPPVAGWNSSQPRPRSAVFRRPPVLRAHPGAVQKINWQQILPQTSLAHMQDLLGRSDASTSPNMKLLEVQTLVY